MTEISLSRKKTLRSLSRHNSSVAPACECSIASGAIVVHAATHTALFSHTLVCAVALPYCDVGPRNSITIEDSKRAVAHSGLFHFQFPFFFSFSFPFQSTLNST